MVREGVRKYIHETNSHFLQIFTIMIRIEMGSKMGLGVGFKDILKIKVVD